MKFLLSLVLLPALFAQGTIGPLPANRVVHGNTLPTNCSIGMIFHKDNATVGRNLYTCVAANTWAAVDAGDGLSSSAVVLPELTASGHGTATYIYGADSQAVSNCIVWPQTVSSNGKAAMDSGSTATMTDGNVCRIFTWQTPGGGGGGSAITSGTYASTPATCTVSDLYLLTSGVFPFARCTGTNVWSFFYYGHTVTPAAQLSLATLGGSAPAPDSLVSTNGYEVMTRSSGGGAAYSYRYWSAPGSTPYTNYAVTLPQTNLYVNAGYKQFAVGFMDASGKSFVLSCGQGTAVISGYFCRGLNVNADGTVNAEISAAVSALAGIGGRELTFVLRDDGTNINIGFSNGGPDYYYASEARTSFLSSPSRLTYGMEVNASDLAAFTFVGTY